MLQRILQSRINQSVRTVNNAFETRMPAALETGRLKVSTINSPADAAAFGGTLVYTPNTRTSMKFTQGFVNTDLYQTDTSGSSTVTVSGSQAVMSIGSAASDLASIQTLRSAQYVPGSGLDAKFSARFDTSNNLANSEQLIGMGNMGSGLYFGFNGPSMGICRQTGGLAEIQSIDVTTGTTIAGQVILTLNDISYALTLQDASTDANFSSYEVARDMDLSGWYAAQRGTSVVLERQEVGVANGTYDVCAGVTGFLANFNQEQAGRTDTKYWTYQSDWNEDVLDASGTSNYTLDPSKMNVYKIQMQWLGAGNIRYFVEDPTTGNLNLVHQIKYPNSSEEVSITNPDMYIKGSVKSLGSTASLSAAMASAAIETDVAPDGIRKGFSNNVTNITLNTEVPVFSIRNNRVNDNGFSSYGQVLPKLLTCASDSTKPVVIRLRTGAGLGDNTTADYPDWTVRGVNSIVDTDIGAQTLTGGEELLTVVLGKNDSTSIDLANMWVLNKGQIFTVTAETTNSTNDITCSLVWEEEI